MRFAGNDSRVALAAVLLAMAAGCVEPRQASPPPVPRPAPAQRPVAPQAATPEPAAAQDWRDIPLTPGDWAYRGDEAGSEARFADAALAFRCDKARRQIRIERAQTGPATELVVRTSFGTRRLAPGAALAPGDPLLDQIAFSRGRFTIETAGLPILVAPAWPEPARVIEDCRG